VSAVADTVHHRRFSFLLSHAVAVGHPHPRTIAPYPLSAGADTDRGSTAPLFVQQTHRQRQNTRTSEVQTPAPLPARLSRTYRYPPRSQNCLLSFLRNEHAADRRGVDMLFFLLHLHEGTLFARLQLHPDVTSIPLAGARCPSRASAYRDRGGTMSRPVEHIQKRSHTTRRALLH